MAVSELLGAPVLHERPAEAGFTHSIASTVIGVGGRRLFVKAAPVGGGLGEAGTRGRAGRALRPFVAGGGRGSGEAGSCPRCGR